MSEKPVAEIHVFACVLSGHIVDVYFDAYFWHCFETIQPSTNSVEGTFDIFFNATYISYQPCELFPMEISGMWLMSRFKADF